MGFEHIQANTQHHYHWRPYALEVLTLASHLHSINKKQVQNPSKCCNHMDNCLRAGSMMLTLLQAKLRCESPN